VHRVERLQGRQCAGPVRSAARSEGEQGRTFTPPSPPWAQWAPGIGWRWSRGSNLVTGPLGSVAGEPDRRQPPSSVSLARRKLKKKREVSPRGLGGRGEHLFYFLGSSLMPQILPPSLPPPRATPPRPPRSPARVARLGPSRLRLGVSLAGSLSQSYGFGA
jgi:hypothetical protein